ncbi:MAG: type II secretion system F family protein [Lentisphaerae bacterium]|nr:type II secretion system F family protein [Lentisphaerota bacterium]
MGRYTYRAIDESGREARGVVDADTQDLANDTLASRGLTVTRLDVQGAADVAAGRASWADRFRTVGSEELILFTKQFGTMLRAGIPVLRVFDILQSQSENPRLKQVGATVAADIRAGSTLFAALSKHKGVFPPLYSSMVLAGETSGALPQVLQRLVYIVSHEHKVKSDVRAALQYPALVLIALTAAFVALITLVIPRFATVYEKMRIELPLPTRICLSLSAAVREGWPWILGGIAVLVGLVAWAVRTEGGRLLRDRLLMTFPLIGPLVVKASLSRFSSILSILQATGVGILDSFEILTGTIGNAAIARELAGIKTQLEQGHGLARPFASARYFTPMFVNMVAIGEESGNLDEMLREVSSHYDAEVEFATKRLTTALGPILTVLLAAMVGFFALAVYLPMWDLAKIATRGG